MYRLLAQSVRRANVSRSLATFRTLRTLSQRVEVVRTPRYEVCQVPGIQSSLYFRIPTRSFSSEKKSSDGKKEEGKEGDENPPDDRMRAIVSMLLISTVVTVLLNSMASDPQRQVSWHEFYHDMLAKGEVEEVVVTPKMVSIILSEGAVIGKPGYVPSPFRRRFVMEITDVKDFERRLRHAEEELGVMPGSTPVVYESMEPNPFLQAALIVLLLVVLMKVLGKSSGMDILGNIRKAKFTVVDNAVEGSKPGVRFNDVAGCHGAKQEIAEFIDYLQDSTKYQRLGAKVPRGVLLLGPPGCGKTMLAKAVAAEAQVPFLAMAGSEFIEMIGGLGAARVRNLFQEARKRAPCIIYIDEIDAIGRKRSENANNSEADQTINQLLVEMDGMSSQSDVIMLASTNMPDILDKALLRPGRFDRQILIDIPNQAERVEIYDKHLSSIVLDKSPSSYSERLAALTPGFSGADIANVCNEAALHAARSKKKFVASTDIEYAVERVLAGTEKKTHAMSLEERQRVAVHEAGRAIVAWFSGNTDNILKISIIPRNKGTLSMARFEPTENKLRTTEDLVERICVALGGRAAESVVYGKAAAGFEEDLKKVTEIAKAMVETYGMDETVGPLSYQDRRPYSKRLANTMDQQEKMLVHKAYIQAVKMVKQNREKLKELSDALIQKEVMNFKDIEVILGPRPKE